MLKLSTIAIGAALALGGIAFIATGVSSQAAGVAAGGVSVLPKLAKTDTLVETVRHRSRHRSHRFRHRYQGFWYAVPFWLYTTPAPAYRYSSNHVEWCLHRYRSYNPRTDLYLGYDGRYHRCRSPYRP